MEKLITLIAIILGIYLLVMIMILADLWSGIRKARQCGEARNSIGYRRTVSKFAQYFNMLIALTVMDAMQMSAVWFLEVYYSYALWMFPFLTLLGALFLSFIELKSIYEKADEKQRFSKGAEVLLELLKNKNDLKEISKILKHPSETSANDAN